MVNGKRKYSRELVLIIGLFFCLGFKTKEEKKEDSILLRHFLSQWFLAGIGKDTTEIYGRLIQKVAGSAKEKLQSLKLDSSNQFLFSLSTILEMETKPTQPVNLSGGKKLYEFHCTKCHQQKSSPSAGGIISNNPNGSMTSWSPFHLFHTIMFETAVLAKGMPPMKEFLTTAEIWDISFYLSSEDNALSSCDLKKAKTETEKKANLNEFSIFTGNELTSMGYSFDFVCHGRKDMAVLNLLLRK